MYGRKRRHIATLGPRDFLAELNLLTGPRAYVSGVVAEAGSILRVPRKQVGPLMDAHGELGAFLVQEMFRRRQVLLGLRAARSHTAGRGREAEVFLRLQTVGLKIFATRSRRLPPSREPNQGD
jgi:CRP-like cAMP-binding protein